MASIRRNRQEQVVKADQEPKEDDKITTKNAQLAQKDGNILSIVTFACSCKMFQ